MTPPFGAPAGTIHRVPTSPTLNAGDDSNDSRRAMCGAAHRVSSRRRAGVSSPPEERLPRPQQVPDCPALCSRAHPGILPAMGRIFEVRKHAMFARWNRMAKQFARIGKDITIAVKSGGADPNNNPTLRRVIQNARAINMPKDRVEAAIKRASGQDATDFQQVLYEGYAPARRRGPRRDRDRQPDAHRSRASGTSCRSTAATLRAMAASASCSRRMGVFRLAPGGHRPGRARARPHRPRPRRDGREHRRERRAAARRPLRLRGLRASSRRRLEERKIVPVSAEQEYICTVPTELPEAQATEVLELIDKLEQDDDVQKVYHTLA